MEKEEMEDSYTIMHCISNKIPFIKIIYKVFSSGFGFLFLAMPVI